MTAIQREHRAFLPVHMQPSCQGYLGDRCRFSCEPGYRPYGNRTCTSWLGEIPPAKYVEVRAFRGGSCVAKSPSKPARAHPDLPADVDFVRTQVDMVSTPGVSGVCSHGADPDPGGDKVPVEVGPQHTTAHWNRGGWRFADITELVGLDVLGDWRGLTVGDLDADGDPDLGVGGLGELPQVFRNDIATEGRGLSLRLRGTTSNPLGLGALLKRIVL